MINDQGYFKQYPAPIFEASCKEHIDTFINHTTPYYGPLLYWLIRCIDTVFAAEVGVCYAYSSYFMAAGVKDNMTRHGLTSGQFYGIDIANSVVEYEKKFRDKGLPVTMIQKDSYDLTKEDFPLAPYFGLVFIDGWHSEQHLRKEIDLFYPLLLDRGRGYLAIHDTHGWVLEPMQKILKDPKYKWEYVRFTINYGLTILRKMDNYVEDPKQIWAQGPQENIRNDDGSLKQKYSYVKDNLPKNEKEK